MRNRKSKTRMLKTSLSFKFAGVAIREELLIDI